MQYLKTHYGRAIPVITSSTIDIPNPANAGASGTATSTTANKLVDSTATFTTNLMSYTVVNNTTGAIAQVTGFTDSTTLNLSADIMISGNSYTIYTTPSIVEGCSLYIPKQTPANITVITAGGDTITFNTCGDTNASMILPVQVKRVTSTTLTGLIALW